MKSDHRKNLRKGCVVPVDGKNDSAFSDICTIDIGSGGLGFISDHPIPVHKRIAVEVELGRAGDPVLMMAEVKWVRPFEDGRRYRIGMKFVRVLSSGSRSRLTQYLGE